jgi:hypothetical protein
VATAPYATASSIIPANGFGCPGGHLNAYGGAIYVSAGGFKGSFGYAKNTGGLCPDQSTASRANLYDAPNAPSGWTPLLYVDMRFSSHPVGGEWHSDGPQRYVEVSDKSGFERHRYYCLAFYVPSEPHQSGTQWTQAWVSATVASNGGRRLRFEDGPPHYTPYFDGPVVEWVNAVFEVLESSSKGRC